MRAALQVLADRGIRHTNGREDILSMFLEHGHALSQPDLERKLIDKYDRVTIYRTLTLYLEKGILHKVLDDVGAMKYALCPDACHQANHHHAHDHVHFKCLRCGNTTCLDQLEVPAIKLPAGYVLEECNLLMSGVCPSCMQ
jgi:Fur family ferric uptake transcriptional regulator